MKLHFILLILSVFLLQSCANYVQVFETNSNNVNIKDKAYIYENDDVRISFNFWEEKGLMSFEIFNKLDIPLYIDWKKSSYIDNTVKLDYWTDKEINLSTEIYSNYYYRLPFSNMPTKKTIGTSVSALVKEERITFIPPKSKYERKKFYIFPYSSFELPKTTSPREVSMSENSNKKTKIYENSYTEKTSPIVFRNFITYSTSENFDKEFYIDCEFYISKIKEMDKRHFEQVKRDKIGRTIYDDNDFPVLIQPFKNKTSFYVRIPQAESIKYRGNPLFQKRKVNYE
ncbi:MAG: hypothetical protein R2771_14130 [Saprospiraceae bacterium]